MLQRTADRVNDRTRYGAPIIVCGAPHARQVEDQLAEAGSAPAMMIVEPVGRNTAPAIALAAASVAADTPLLVMPSDHVVEKTEPFRRAVDLALTAALDGRIITFGRSEEHTSELPSLLRISYAVFCLKKKTTTHTNTP